MRIVDDALLAKDFEQLRTTIFDKDFPWFYARKTFDDEIITNPYLYGWVHFVMPQRSYGSQLSDTLPGLLFTMLERHDEIVERIIRIRIVMNTTAPEPWLNGVHTDYSRPHRTALLYLDDADGDTVVYRETYEPDHVRDPSQLTVLGTISPKPNRLAVFDGLHLHTGTLPVKANRRVVLNVNYFA